jgi:multiple sugar transport system ATP-binding protein
MAAITIKDLRKEYTPGVAAVEGLNLSIREGEFLTLLGPSGCGKSTTLRMIAGLETPTAGEIHFNDRIVNDLTPAQRNIAMVFQNYALYPHMTVRQNIGYPLRKRRVSKAENVRRTLEVAQLLQIEPLLDRKPRSLSGGQQQRVALGRALIRQPELFLLDEPLSNLDAKLRSYMRAELIELHRRVKATMIYVTHDQLEAMTMSDRVAIFDSGFLQQVGSPETVYNQPANLIVASFIGTPPMNFIVGVLGGGDERILRAGSLEIPLPSVRAENASSTEVTLGVRPEHVLLGEQGLPGRVAIVEPSGHETIVTLVLDGIRMMTRVAPGTTLAVGQQVGVSFDLKHMHLFDTRTGKAITSKD